jgi:hypothetical protein
MITNFALRSGPVICFIVRLKPIEQIVPSTKTRLIRLYSVFKSSTVAFPLIMVASEGLFNMAFAGIMKNV